MHGLQSGVLLAIAVAWTAASAEAQPWDTASRTNVPTRSSASLHNDAPVKLFAGTAQAVESARVQVPGATFVRLHFERIDLPDGVTVEVGNPTGTEVYRYRNGHFDGHTLDRSRGDDGRNRF